MLNLYYAEPQGLVRREGGDVASALWLDLHEPTADEEHSVEAQFGIDVPTRDEMREIEASSRLYEEAGAVFMTTTIVTRLDTDQPQNDQVTFILKEGKLVTNRYSDPMPFRRYAAYAERHPQACNTGVAIFTGLVEAMINRIADAIERAAADLEAVSVGAFRHVGARGPRRDYRDLLERLGKSGELVAKSRESLASLERALAFVQQSGTVQLATEVRARLRTATRDVTALSDHAAFVGNNLGFVLDATLGMISIDQNDILKIFSVVTVLLLPPSVIGAIYGMNFEHIPGLHEPWGFAGALGLMLCSSLLPYWLFRRRGWL